MIDARDWRNVAHEIKTERALTTRFDRAGQSGEGVFAQLWNRLSTLHESKLLDSRSRRNNRIKKPLYLIALRSCVSH
jgi:hypothetical protein